MSRVDAADLRRFSQVVQDTLRLSFSCEPEAFQAESLLVAGKLLAFDGSFWGIASTEAEGLDPHAVHLDRVAPEAAVECASIAPIDVVARWVVANPGRTLHFDTSCRLLLRAGRVARQPPGRGQAGIPARHR